MEVLRELDVMRFITRGGQVFVCPQFDIPYDRDLPASGNNPDILALDFGAREIVVIEVSMASDIGNMLINVGNRQARWYDPIKRNFEKHAGVLTDWRIRFLGFVRKTNVERAKKRFASDADVSFYAIEEATFDWDYWEKRLTGGLPR